MASRSRAWVSAKIKKLIGEGKPQKQAVAQALNMAGLSRKDRARRRAASERRKSSG